MKILWRVWVVRVISLSMGIFLLNLSAAGGNPHPTQELPKDGALGKVHLKSTVSLPERTRLVVVDESGHDGPQGPHFAGGGGFAHARQGWKDDLHGHAGRD